MTEAAVTQEDRKAAAPFCWADTPPETERLRDGVRSGELDRHSLVQAFARHRITALSDSAATIAKLREALEPFAGVTSRIRADDPDNDRPALATVADYRRARITLEETNA